MKPLTKAEAVKLAMKHFKKIENYSNDARDFLYNLNALSGRIYLDLSKSKCKEMGLL